VQGGYKLANVSRHGRFLNGFHHPLQNLFGHNKTALLPSFGHHVGFSVGWSTPVTFLLPNLTPLQIARHTFSTKIHLVEIRSADLENSPFKNINK